MHYYDIVLALELMMMSTEMTQNVQGSDSTNIVRTDKLISKCNGNIAVV